MISIIICSYRRQFLASLEKNIAETIGVPYELVVIDNTIDKRGICKIYNEGAIRAKFDILCFVHEDVNFITQNWGVTIVQELKDPSVGLIGIAGGQTKSLAPSSWSSLVSESEIHLVQHYASSPGNPQIIHKSANPADNSSKHFVTCLDGVLLFTRKEQMNRHKFDEVNFPGFHGYDLDISLQIGRNYKVAVVSTVLVEHFSEGKFNREWVASMIVLSKKWRRYLPLSVLNLSPLAYATQHWTALRHFCEILRELGYSRKFIFAQVLYFSQTKYFRPGHFLSLCKYSLLSKN